jgi:serine/threonine protein phosphatase PrpC
MLQNTNVCLRAYATYSDKGSQRPINEDSVYTFTEKNIFGIADGYGGNNIGDVAARHALDYAGQFIKAGLGDSEVTLPFVFRDYLTDGGNLVFNALLFANQKLIDDNRGRHINGRGGASALLTFLTGNKMIVGNVGLCQGTLIRRGRVQPLLKPRSYNALRGVFQGSWNTQWAFPLIGLGHSTHLEPEILELQVESGDVVILSTDGIYPRLVDEDFSECYRALKGAERLDLGLSEQNQRLAELALQKGSVDNQSMITMVYGA